MTAGPMTNGLGRSALPVRPGHRVVAARHDQLAHARRAGVVAAGAQQFRRVPASQRPALYLPEPTRVLAVRACRAATRRARASSFRSTTSSPTRWPACARWPRTRPRAAFEIIVVDDGSSDDTQRCLPQVAGLRYHRRAQNGGFIAACNDGAALARGEFLVFLNNDTVPQPGWLDALLATFDEHPGTGLVGRAAGLSGRPPAGGRRHRVRRRLRLELRPLRVADRPALRVRARGRLLLRRGDRDAARAVRAPGRLRSRATRRPTTRTPTSRSRVRARGLKVLYQPASRGRAPRRRHRRHRHRPGHQGVPGPQPRTFPDKWRAALARHMPAGATRIATRARRRHAASARAGPRRATPQPDRDSGSLRLVNLMRLLREEGAHVVFLPADSRP